MILNVHNLCKSYPSFALRDVAFSVPRGYVMGFVGQNGAGKSTTIKCLMDVIPYEAGSIELFGEPYKANPLAMRNRIGYVGEDMHFYEEMSVEWTCRFVGGFYPQWDNKQLSSYLSRFQLDPRKKIRELSRGMKVKLGLALALSHHPELLILDEPTSGLDPVVRSELMDVFREFLQEEGRSIFFSSHISSDIEKIADYVTVIDEGRIVVSEEKHRLLDEWLLVKGDKRLLTDELSELLFGMKESEFGFSGIAKEPARFAAEWRRAHSSTGSTGYKTEKLTLDELLVRIVKEDTKAWAR